MLSRDDAFTLLASMCRTRPCAPTAWNPRPYCAPGYASGPDAELWGITGLLHDLDYATTKDARRVMARFRRTAGRTAARGRPCGNPRPQAEHTGFAPATPLDFALRCGETVTGLIHTNALVRPARMEGMDAKSLKKKMKDKAFAASVNRETIGECQKLGLEQAEFFTLAIAAVAGVAKDVGLA
jgi:predicted hydrolase (HD superfamily)